MIDNQVLGDAVTVLVCAVAAVAVVRTVVGLLLTAMSGVPGVVGRVCARAARLLTPLLVRRLVVGGVAAGVVVAPSVAHAAPSSVRALDRLPELDRAPALPEPIPGASSPAPSAPTPGGAGEVQPLNAAPDLDRAGGVTTAVAEVRPTPVGRPAPSGRPGPASASASAAYVVRPDDTLWSIAARHLPAGADDAAIDREWRRWYHANRAVIGGDPDVIVPGQRLLPPL